MFSTLRILNLPSGVIVTRWGLMLLSIRCPAVSLATLLKLLRATADYT